MIIRLKVFEQTLSIADMKSVPRKGSKDYLVLHFLFSSDWKGLNKVCYLQHGEVSQPIDVVDGLVEVPEWFTEQDSFDVTLFGKGGSQEVPTNVVSLRLEKSNTLWEQDAPEPQPSWLAKIIDLNNHPPIPGDNGYWMLWDTESGAYVESDLPLPAGGSGGTSDHSKLINRDNADQHPMSAVTGLVEALNGKQPAGDYLTQDNLQSATNAALEQAKASGEFDGTDGTTPHIGDNGNWYLGDTDTGKPSRGDTGATGPKGDKGADGKSAYQYAQEGGYTGTEAAFVAKLAQEKFANPTALTFTGAVTGSYDGSVPLEVAIPSGGGGLTVANTAAVGQTVKITAVDENGQPTEWEAVDFSSGGDAEKRVRHIATVSVTEGTTSYDVTVDSNGDALNLESVYILTEKFWGNTGSYVQISINRKELARAYGQSGSPQVLELEKMGELQKFTNIPKPSDVGISFGDYYNGKSAVTSVGFWSVTSTVNTTIEIYGVDA